jgi:hypothetical protein
LVEKWDDYQEVEIQEKIGNVDNLTTLEKGHIMNHIIFKYMRLKSVKFNIKSYDEVYNTLLKIINDPEFREFTFNRYHVFIYQEVTGKSICISKISNEILTFIHNRGNLSDDELLIRVKELIRKSKFLQANPRMDKA